MLQQTLIQGAGAYHRQRGNVRSSSSLDAAEDLQQAGVSRQSAAATGHRVRPPGAPRCSAAGVSQSLAIRELESRPRRPEVLLGVVASDSRLAVRALRDWCQALDLPYTPPDCKVAGASSIATVKGAVYVKYNSVSRVCYMSLYQGRDRGVLVQLGPGQLLGHFPLGFWDEAMANPAPSLEQLPQLPEQQPQLQ